MISLAYTFVFLLLGEALVTGEIFFKNGAPHVKLSKSAGITGHTRFSRDGRPFVSFEGIPFAKVRERFTASELLSEPDWENFKDVSTPGVMCAQLGMAGPDAIRGQEDCLSLSVHVPLDVRMDDKLKPVMVQVHGGGFVVGTGMGFRGSFFMDEDVILVSINYRVGVFGFLSTGDEVVPGNNGLKDQVTALKWVNQNIKKFGGNPDLVTVFGESAGSASTHYLKLSTTTKGLIHRVISQSGLAISPWAYEPNPRENAVLLAKHLNCDAKNAEEITSDEIASCLKKIPMKVLVKAAGVFKEVWPPSPISMIFVPVAEPKPSPASTNVPFITVPPAEIMRGNVPDANKNIPWLTGMTSEEGISLGGGMIVGTESVAQEMNERWNEVALKALFNIERFLLPEDRPIVASKLKEFYFKGKPVSYETRTSLYNIYSDIFGNYVLKRGLEMAVAKGDRVYLYQFSYLGKRSLIETMFKIPNVDQMVTHGDDVLYQDENPRIIPEMDITEKFSSEDDEFSRNFVRLFASFARDGKPTHTWGNVSDKKWTPVSKEEASGKKPLKYYDINANPSFIEEPFKKRMDFLDSLHKYYERGYVQSHKNVKTEL